MTTRLLTSEASTGNPRPDAVVIGITEYTGGPRLAPGAEPINQALGGTLISALAALGATGKAEEVTK
ncbi:MAG: leucyl aminopeptidase, partial [Streptosporangiaceae bacterium]